MNSQSEQILKYLQAGNALTPLEALRKFNCLRLGVRIYDLRQKGYVINSFLTTHTAMHAAESASALFNAGDKYRAGLAFKTAYERIVSEKKAKGIQPDWYVSAGLDKEQLAQLITEAAATGKITNDYALALLPAGEERMNIEAGNLLTDKQKEEGKARLGNLLNLITQKCALN
ncbi:helix-turn-helix domain-containing protein [Snodgrassella alvi]|uniref:Helix-turn-helix domain-containing protein n=1 Tax=Snodgrassella alvi TaxID=1196083 RepID=A0ABD7Z527_9NEIS|nr:helix-turn-helix domain-containing protein [Snodgrassella alvi]WLS99514.1 helix-turn-helix domain-containing protein [Snodgrassella alvi]